MSDRSLFRVTKRSAALAAIIVASNLLPGSAKPASAQLRPLVRDMLANLGAVNRIGEGLALDDLDRVEDAAREL